MKKNPELFVKGYYIISVASDRLLRFVNYCQKNDISLSEAISENSSDDVSDRRFIISIKDYRTLAEFLDKAQIECKIISEKGIPALLKNRCMQAVLVLLLLGIIGISIINLYIWNISVKGSTYYTSEQLRSWVCENVVAIGTRKKELVCSELEYRIKEGLDKVNWVSCSIKKTTLIIDIYDTADGSEVQEDGSTGDIISDTDCIITDIIPVSGTPLVSVGDKVKKGDVLISGEVTIYNDYGEEVDTAIVAAKGYVTGEITENYSDTIEYERQEKLYDTGFKSFSLGYGDTGADILTPKITQPYDVDIEQKRLSLGESCYLPFYITTYNVHPYSVVSVTNTEQQLKEIMSKRIEAYVSGLQKKGVEIVENNVKIYIDEKGCHAKGNIKYKKTIGYKGD